MNSRFGIFALAIVASLFWAGRAQATEADLYWQCVGPSGVLSWCPAGSIYPLPNGPAFKPVTPPTAFPSAIAGGGSYTSGIISMQGFRGVTAAVTSTQAGSISIQRYADAAGTIAVGSAISQAITASTPATVSVNDGLPAGYLQVTISNSSGSTATVTNPVIVMTGM